MAKSKTKNIIVKLFSTAQTGIMRTVLRPRSSPTFTQVRYDPVVKRHVLFTETKKRTMAPVKPLNFARR